MLAAGSVSSGKRKSTTSDDEDDCCITDNEDEVAVTVANGDDDAGCGVISLRSINVSISGASATFEASSLPLATSLLLLPSIVDCAVCCDVG